MSFYRCGLISHLFMVFGLSLLFLQITSSATVTKRNTDEATSNVENWIEDTKNSLWGGKCITDNDCSIVSYCNNDVLSGGDFECKLQWWFILAVAVVALFIISSIISCLCCPCCLLYSCGKAICNCLCCCSPSRGRYSRP